MMITDAQFDKLPKWAQRELSRLEGNASYWERKATAGPEQSNTFSEHGERPLGTDETIRFHLDDKRDRMGDVIEARLDGNRLRVVAPSSMLAISPQSSNIIYVTIRED